MRRAPRAALSLSGFSIKRDGEASSVSVTLADLL